jgi:hypothetical protein
MSIRVMPHRNDPVKASLEMPQDLPRLKPQNFHSSTATLRVRPHERRCVVTHIGSRNIELKKIDRLFPGPAISHENFDALIVAVSNYRLISSPIADTHDSRIERAIQKKNVWMSLHD